MVSDAKITSFQNKILQFYKEKGRNLPWRHTTNPYYILLSEVMLQQTQVSRGLIYYEAWTTEFPTIEDLAKAERKKILEMWMGLGYNNRAIRLHEAAKKIVEEYNSDVLKAMVDFKNIPGIGPYTSQAVQIFSANRDIITVDTNIRRILIHEFKLDENVKDDELWELAEKCLPKGKSRDWHNALMDYGATYLTSRKTGIKPKTKQSKFEGSDRQIRAKILRYLLEKEKATLSNLIKNVEQQKTLIDQKERYEKIIKKMIKDKVIKKEKENYVLA